MASRHGGEIDHRRHAGEILHQHPRRTEWHLAVRVFGLEPGREALDFPWCGASFFIARMFSSRT